MNSLPNFVKKIPQIKALIKLADEKKIKVWLVGGFLRDVFLKIEKPLIDFDFCVEKNCKQFAYAAAKVLDGKCIVLDEQESSYRVIVKKEIRNSKIENRKRNLDGVKTEIVKKEIFIRYDFSQMRGKTLREDVFLRDFTVNTLAIDITCRSLILIDECGAIADMNKKNICVPQNRVLIDDPLRILRGFSLMSQYGFKIQSETLKTMIDCKDLLNNVSSERVSEEFFKIISSNKSFSTLKLMDEAGILDVLFKVITPMRGMEQGTYHHLDVWNHSLEAYRQFEILYDRQLARNPKIVNYLNYFLAQNRNRLQILKLAVLLHDAGKPQARAIENKRTIFHAHAKFGADMVKNIAEKLKFSRNESAVLINYVFWHMRPGELTADNNPSRRAVYHFFRDTADSGIGVLLLGIADWRATCGRDIDQTNRKIQERLIFKIIKQRFIDLEKKPLPKLLDGYKIMKLLKIKPSPSVGEILKKIKEAQALGKIKTKSQAIALVKAVFHGNSIIKISSKQRQKNETAG